MESRDETLIPKEQHDRAVIKDAIEVLVAAVLRSGNLDELMALMETLARLAQKVIARMGNKAF